MSNINIEQFLSDKAREQMENMTMDVAGSFMTGNISSPLLMKLDNLVSPKDELGNITYSYVGDAVAIGGAAWSSANKAFTLSEKVAQTGMASLNAAGIYITKNGDVIDINTDLPEKGIQIATSILAAAKDALKAETNKMLNYYTQRILTLPDPKYIPSYITAYFGEWLKGDTGMSYWTNKIMNVSSLMTVDMIRSGESDGGDVSAPNFLENEKTEKAMSKVSYWCNEKLPQITYKVETVVNNITEKVTGIAQYTVQGQQWVCDQANFYINQGLRILDSEAEKVCETSDRIKYNIYNSIGKELTEKAIIKFEKLMQDIYDDMSLEIKKKMAVAEVKVKNALITNTSNICAKLGISVNAIDLTSLAHDPNLIQQVNNIKNKTKLAQMLLQLTGTSDAANSVFSPYDEGFASFATSEAGQRYLNPQNEADAATAQRNKEIADAWVAEQKAKANIREFAAEITDEPWGGLHEETLEERYDLYEEPVGEYNIIVNNDKDEKDNTVMLNQAVDNIMTTGFGISEEELDNVLTSKGDGNIKPSSNEVVTVMK